MSRVYALLIRGWNEIPEIVGTTAIAIVGLGFGAYATYRHTQMGNKSRYKQHFTIMRPDDPRTRFIREWEFTYCNETKNVYRTSGECTVVA